MTSKDWLPVAQRLHALAQTGLAYTTSDYDRERYEEIRDISLRLLAEMSDVTVERIMQLLPVESGYVTPKVDVRAIIFRGTGEILMVQEKMDADRWTVPGGWADVGYTPFEVAEKEALEETGLVVKAKKLLAVWDKSRHAHPYEPWYVYKFFILCEEKGGELLAQTSETTGAEWIPFEKVSELPISTYRVTLSQLTRIFEFAINPELPTICD